MRILKRKYATEFKEQAVKQVKLGQSIGAVAKDLVIIGHTQTTGSAQQ